MQVLSTAENLYRYGAGDLRWIESLSLAVACLAAVPLEEPSRRGLPWQQQLHTPNGSLAGMAFVVFLGLFLSLVIHGELASNCLARFKEGEETLFFLIHFNGRESDLWSRGGCSRWATLTMRRRLPPDAGGRPEDSR